MKQARKACQKFIFLPVSKAHTSDNTCVYIYDISIKNLCLKSNLRTYLFIAFLYLVFVFYVHLIIFICSNFCSS
jgi:hypothetical protein